MNLPVVNFNIIDKEFIIKIVEGMNFVKFWAGLLLIILLAQALLSAEPRQLFVDKILKDSWRHYKEFKIEKNTARPLADSDNFDVANGSHGQYLTFSETVSYVLYRAVLINDREVFDRTWNWAVKNLQRKNIAQVFDWQEQKWIPVPAEKRDSLFAWRYTPNINGSGQNGVIYYYWTPENEGKLWRDGLDVAPDGDQLIAGALILAHVRWKSQEKKNYKQEAIDILEDLWQKTVNDFKPGEITFSKKNLKEWFKYKSEQGDMSLIGTEKNIKVVVKDTIYAGLGRLLSDCDLSGTGPLKVYLKGNGFFRVILEDKENKKLYSHNNILKSPNKYEEFIIQFNANDQDFNFKKVKLVMLEFSNGKFELQRLVLDQRPDFQNKRYHLYSNDKNQPWVNVSYYMPFLYRIFAKVDSTHPWLQLAEDAYKDMRDSMFAELKNNRDELFVGNGTLFPNWLTYNELGEIVDLPWAVDGFIDDYMSGWDAFRTWYFMAVDKYWHGDLGPEYFLSGKTYEFFRDQLEKFGEINTGYTIAGERRNVNWVGQSSAGSNGAYLAFFRAANDRINEQKILKAILESYDKEGFWENKNEYYKQNWVWLGLAFYAGLGDDIFAEINSRKVL